MTNNLDIQNIINNIKKELKIDMLVGSDIRLKLNRISTGIEQLDKILGGGIPRKRTTIFVGDFSTGKTYIALQIIKSVQGQGGIAAFVDVEKTFDKDWAEKIGVNVDNLIVSQPTFGDEAIDIIVELLKNNVDIIVLDSIAALIPPEEYDERTGHQFIGLQARLVNKALRKITACYNLDNKSIFIAINQLRANIGGYGIKETMPGGMGQEFFASLIMKVARRGWITDVEEGKRKIGFNIECLLTKSKISPPFQSCIIPFLFTTGQIDEISSIMQLAIDGGIVEKKGNTYFYKGDKLSVGKGGLLDYLKVQPEMFNQIKEQVLSL